MRRRRRRAPDGSRVPRQLPFIDVVFLLLIFFALTAKILLPEGDLRANLPRLGLRDLSRPPLPSVRIFLEWIGGAGDTQRCVAKTFDYRPAAGEPRPRHEFGTLTPGDESSYAPNFRVDYSYPDFREIREYLRSRRDAAATFGDQVPVILHFSNEVPAQMIINVLDICVQLGLEDFSLAAEAVD